MLASEYLSAGYTIKGLAEAIDGTLVPPESARAIRFSLYGALIKQYGRRGLPFYTAIHLVGHKIGIPRTEDDLFSLVRNFTGTQEEAIRLARVAEPKVVSDDPQIRKLSFRDRLLRSVFSLCYRRTPGRSKPED